MSVKNIALKQYRNNIKKISKYLTKVDIPKEGSIRTTRKALGLSAAQLSRRLGKSKTLISNTEKAELDGAVTLKTMKKAANAMGCDFVYGFIPKTSIEKIIEKRAREKATKLVSISSRHMALEKQALSSKAIEREIEHLTKQIIEEMPSDLWKDNI